MGISNSHNSSESQGPRSPAGTGVPPSRNLPDCSFTASMPLYIAGALDPEQSSQLERHVGECAACSELVDTMTDSSDATLRALGSAPICDDDEPELQAIYARLMQGPVGGRLAAPPLGPLPQTLGKYELTKCVGRGGWGAVYLATHTKLDQRVAVKVLDASRWPAPQNAERFASEWRAIGKLCHANIVRATDAGEDRGFHYLVMEYIDGPDVGRLLHRAGPLRAADAAEIVRQAALALEFAHQRGLVHRDVKPSNLLLTNDGVVKLADLGIAGHGEDRAAAAATSLPLGTAEYMPPEQWTNFEGVDCRGDIYSLGVTLYKLLTGRFPPRNAADEPGAALRAQRPDVPARLARLVAQMAADKRDARVATAAEVAARLASDAARADLSGLINSVQSGLHRTAVADRLPPQPTRRRVMAGAAAATVVAVGTPWLWGERAPQLRRATWRDLPLQSARIWLATAAGEGEHVSHNAEGRLTIDAEGLTLVDLGRPVSGRFSLQVTFVQQSWPGHAGLYFCGGRVGPQGETFHFQTLELRPADGRSRRLSWSQWRVTLGEPHPAVIRTPLADVVIKIQSGRAQLLQADLGHSGFPMVSWNGEPLPTSQWDMSEGARRLAGLPANDAQRRHLGRIGLFSNRVETVFEWARLSYTA